MREILLFSLIWNEFNAVKLVCFSNNSNPNYYNSRDHVQESSLSLRDILPIRQKHYDKNRAPKLQGQPTIVYFHVTVLSLDSINEESMASTLISICSHNCTPCRELCVL